MRSMNRIMDLPMERLVLFTAVGKIIEDGRKALKNCMEYFKELARKTKAMEQAVLSLNDIINNIFGGENAFAKLTNGQFSTFNLVSSILKTLP